MVVVVLPFAVKTSTFVLVGIALAAVGRQIVAAAPVWVIAKYVIITNSVMVIRLANFFMNGLLTGFLGFIRGGVDGLLGGGVLGLVGVGW